jgi:acyl-CoA thioesterase FadM
MPRIKIPLPDKFIFQTEIPVRINDINYGGHLGNDSVLSICHESRVRFLNSIGFSELDIDGAGIIMIDAAVQYKKEAFHGDILLVKIGISNITKIGCDLIYLLTGDENEIAIVKTGIVFYDYATKKTVPVPGVFNERIGLFE